MVNCKICNFPIHNGKEICDMCEDIDFSNHYNGGDIFNDYDDNQEYYYDDFDSEMEKH